MAWATAVPVTTAQTVPLPLPFLTDGRGDPAQAKDKAPELRMPGSGAAAVTVRQGSVAVSLDNFAKRSGPDASIQTAAGVVSVHAVFQLDAKTRELSVMIVGEDGQLIRMIPPESVARMIAAMAAYRGR
jgi:hypothetical protein